MGKAKRSINPADALRKAQRKRELKKNKEIRKSAREAGLAKKDTEKLRIDIGRLEGQERSGTLDKNGQTRLTQFKEELAQIEKAKKEVNKPLSKAQEALAARQQQQTQTHDSRKLVFDPNSGKFVPVKRKESTKKSGVDGGDHEDRGSDESSESDDSDSDLSDDNDEETGIIGIEVEMDDDQQQQLKQVGDMDMEDARISDTKDSMNNVNAEEEDHDNDDIPMPEGPPPPATTTRTDSQATDSDDDIDIPLPPGPPPPRPFQNQLSTTKSAQSPYHTSIPVRPPPPPPGPPPALRYPGMRPPPPPPPRPPHFMQRSPYGQPPPYMQQQPPYMQHQPPYIQQQPSYQHHYRPRPASPYRPPYQQQGGPVNQQQQQQQQHVPLSPSSSTQQQSSTAAEPAKPVTISAEPQLRDLQKELVGFIPAALRRKQAQAKKTESLPKGARPNDINLAPDVE